jgi:hypothetical protein
MIVSKARYVPQQASYDLYRASSGILQTKRRMASGSVAAACHETHENIRSNRKRRAIVVPIIGTLFRID